MNLCNRITRSLAAVVLLSSATASAVQPLEISDVFVQEVDPHDLLTTRHDHLIVLGKNFMNGGVIELWLGDFSLEVLSQMDTEITAEMPILIGAGSYQLVAVSGGGTVRHDDFDGVTIGVQGLPGLDGADGAAGATGVDGRPGADGTSCSATQGAGAATVTCTNGTTATVSDGAVGPQGEQGIQGPPGSDGLPGNDGEVGTTGPAGVACWDLDGDGQYDMDTEDFNGDAVVDVNDCKGDQVINLVVEIPEVPGLVAQDFVTIFPESARNTAFIEIDGICFGPAVIVNGPGFEIEVIPGFRQDGLPQNESGLSVELPLVIEVDEYPNNPFDCASKIPAWLADISGLGFKSMSIIVRDPSGMEQVRWNLYGVLPISEAPGFDGRKRFVLEVSVEFSPSTGNPVSNPNNIVSIDRESAGVFGSGPLFPSNHSNNRDTDKAVDWNGISFAYPAIELEDQAAARLVLVYDATEAGPVFLHTKDIATTGTINQGRRAIAVWSEDQNGFEIPGSRFNYYECFPIRWEQFAGFRQFASLKERVTVQCGSSEQAF